MPEVTQRGCHWPLRVLAYLPCPTVLQSCQHVIAMTWAAAGPASERNRGALHRLPTFTQYCKHETITRCLQAVSVSARLLSVLCFALAPSPVRCFAVCRCGMMHAVRPAQAFTALACPSLSPVLLPVLRACSTRRVCYTQLKCTLTWPQHPPSPCVSKPFRSKADAVRVL